MCAPPPWNSENPEPPKCNGQIFVPGHPLLTQERLPSSDALKPDSGHVSAMVKMMIDDDGDDGDDDGDDDKIRR